LALEATGHAPKWVLLSNLQILAADS